MTKLIKVKDLISGQVFYYTAIKACLMHVENPLEVSQRRWSQIVKEKGYPFEHSGCRVSLLYAMTIADVNADNPAII